MLHKSGKDVLLVDADADAPNLHLILGTDFWEETREYSDTKVAMINDDKCIKCGECIKVCPYDAIYIDSNNNYHVNEILCEGCVTCKLVCPVKDAITYRKARSGVLRKTTTEYGFPLISGILDPGRPNTGKLVTEEKDWAKNMAGEDSLIIVDSAAGIGCQVVSSLAGAQTTILVVEPTPASVSDMKRVFKLARHFMQPSMIIINKYDLDIETTNYIKGFAEDNGIHLLGLVPYDDSVPESMALRKPLIEVFPESEASKALIEISNEFREILSNWMKWYMKYRPKKPKPYIPVIIKPDKL